MAIAATAQIISQQSTTAVASFTTTAITVTAGNAVVATMSASAGSLQTAVTATDSKLDAFSHSVTKANAAGTLVCGIDVAPSLAGGSTTFTVTPNATGFCSISAQEYSGMAAAPKEATNSGEGSTTAVSPGAVNPASSGDLYVSCWTHDGTTIAFTFNASGEGWTQRSNLTNGANQPLGSQDIITSGSKTGSATLASAANWECCVGTFKAATIGSSFVYHRQTRPFPFLPGSPSR